MNWYDRVVLPTLLNTLMKSPEMTRIRARQIPKAQGRVIEIGVGSGLNLPFYEPGTQVFAIDPSEELQVYAKRVAQQSGTDVVFSAQSGESIPADDNSFDTAVITWTLCTIKDALKALDEVRRVLKPHGKLVFAEHGLAPDASVVKWQNRINPVWRSLAGGCNLNRSPEQLLTQAGFSFEELQCGYIAGPKIATYTYQGVASVR
ncbi:MAG: class I SAM-dependent methyltransferase [Gammaproteobacteria bacterium]|jgi:ubiquinone/menaquinone biosynthesis C-methylase UbiE|nr:class I SAM-dependent methyltransferase [Gammaproteobacteria bacterium]MBT5205272.1 class I SAM-dependent methyltransferase [Gammaproteobacteria bacterium]MBT5602988.1 class I SAM-dependent methyltransferase [Gammaproteobacteria bacterium]MBT6244416.1 class I SAM-dependent methyltransferase [Gammaproteobacteria bacterium]